VPTQSQSLLKQPQTIYLTTRGNVFGQQQGRVVIPKLNIKVEPGTAGEPHCCMHLFNLLFWIGISLNLSRNTHLWHTGWLTPQMNAFGSCFNASYLLLPFLEFHALLASRFAECVAIRWSFI
jgi:hypothetical protein